MSSQEQTLLSLLSHVALDGGLGVVLAVTAVRSVLKFFSNSNALKILRSTPSVSVGDLPSLPDSYDDKSSGASEKLVIVRGTVEAKMASENSWKSGQSNFFVSRESGNGAVIIQKTQTCIYEEWKWFLGWKLTYEQNSMPLKMVPFVLVDHGRSVSINMEGSKHPLPLITECHQLPCTFSRSLRGHKRQVGLLDEEKILPLGKNITVVGLCSINDGITEIKSCKDLPYFLSDLTKDQMIVDLSFKTTVLFWGGICLGSLSAAVLGYAIYRNWNRWKSWRQQNQTQQRDNDKIIIGRLQNQTQQRDNGNITFGNITFCRQTIDHIATEQVPDGGCFMCSINRKYCFICLTMNKRSYPYTPCGDLVCCQRCATSFERGEAPRCPICNLAIQYPTMTKVLG